MSSELSLDAVATLDELDRIDSAIGEFSQGEDWPPKLEYQVRLIIEELVMNVIKHGGDEGGKIRISFVSTPESLTIEFNDGGVAFDPLKDAPEPDLESSVEDRAVGGVGVHLVRSMTDEASYRREGDRNCLTLVKKRDG